MQRLSGLLLILAGAGLASYVYLPAPQDGAETLAEVTRIAAAPDRGGQAPNEDRIRIFSATSPAFASSIAPAAAAARITSTTQADTKTPGAWTAVVTTDASSNSGKLKSSKPGDFETRVELTRDLQRELKRVGCYSGEATGNWTPATKRAMAAFMDRVNATLPIEEPDYILLTLVQGHGTVACGASCGTGEVMSEAGRCVPQAVVAQAERKSQRAEARRMAQEQSAAQQERIAQEQRATEQKKLAEQARERQQVADARSAQKIAAKAKSDTQAKLDAKRIADEASRVATQTAKAPAKPQAVAVAEPEKLPWLTDRDDAAKAAAASQPRPEPLPGRMAMGGPVAQEPELPRSAAAISPQPGPMPDMTGTIDVPAADNADLQTDPVLRAPPKLAVRPPAGGAEAGLPGTKSGVAVHRPLVGTAKAVRPTKSARKTPSRPVVAEAERARPTYYASNSGSGLKPRRGSARAGSMQYIMLQAMGAVY